MDTNLEVFCVYNNNSQYKKTKQNKTNQRRLFPHYFLLSFFLSLLPPIIAGVGLYFGFQEQEKEGIVDVAKFLVPFKVLFKLPT